jgi:protein-S-isoprenylcysteine O-methyltransferase Ste14
LILLPIIFIYFGLLIKGRLNIELNGKVEFFIAVVSLIIGLFFLVWTTVYQWKIGKGIPMPNAPTQHLVTTGPYKLCRNPIELGAIFYYLGTGAMTGGIIVGISSFILGLIIGSIYHKFIEESELEMRFGDEYRQYRKETPFLFPTLKSLLKSH